MKKLLLVYPNNFLHGATGTNSRVMQLVNMFKQTGFRVDQFAYADFSADSSFEGFESQNKTHVIHRLFLYPMRSEQKGYANKSKKKAVDFKNKINNKLKAQFKKEILLDWAPARARRYFKAVVEQHQYEVIAVFYIYLAPLLEGLSIKAKKVYFMEDSYFIQQYALSEKKQKGLTVGRLLDEEIKRLGLFDEIICISNDEKVFYEKITGKYIHFLPHLLADHCSKTETPVRYRKWDVFFIGADNPFNIEGIQWFLKEVYPYLKSSNLKILLAGSSVRHLDVEDANITKISYVENLDQIYEQVKVTICPMLRGTGMKIKVVESMAKNIPVVCTERGVDGFADKTLCGCLVTQDAAEFADYINRLCEDDSFYDRQRKQIAEYYDNVFCIDRYKDFINDVLG